MGQAGYNNDPEASTAQGKKITSFRDFSSFSRLLSSLLLLLLRTRIHMASRHHIARIYFWCYFGAPDPGVDRRRSEADKAGLLRKPPSGIVVKYRQMRQAGRTGNVVTFLCVCPCLGVAFLAGRPAPAPPDVGELAASPNHYVCRWKVRIGDLKRWSIWGIWRACMHGPWSV